MIMGPPVGHPSPYATVLGDTPLLHMTWGQVIRVLGLLSLVSEKGKRRGLSQAKWGLPGICPVERNQDP